MNLEDFIILIVAGLFSGFVNTLASSGSAITLPLLLFLGLPANVANGTNRIPILASSIISVLTFQHAKVLDWKNGIRLGIPVVIGSITGSFLASIISSKTLNWAIIAAVVFAFFILLLRPKRWLKEKPAEHLNLAWIQMLILFVVGLWAGFIVLDSATYMLFALVLGVGYDLIRANAIKSLFLFFVSFSSLLIFYEEHEVNWKIGGILAAGSMVGGWFGAKMASKEWAKTWIYRALLIVILGELIHLLYRFVFIHKL